MIRHTDGNLHALDAHERSSDCNLHALAEFEAMAREVERNLVGVKYYELKGDAVVERAVESVEVHEEHRGLLRTTVDETVVCWVSEPTCEIYNFADDDRYYVTRDEAEEAVRETA